jgi:DNA-binding NtrC family response regulator
VSTILVVEDDASLLDVICRTVERWGHDPLPARSGEEAVCVAASVQPDLAVIDIRLPGMDGVETFKVLRSKYSWLPAIVLTGYPSFPGCVEAMKAGFSDYLDKPFHPERLLASTEGVLGRRPRARDGDVTGGAFAPAGGFDDLVGACAAMREVYRRIARAAATTERVLIVGETGTGKELAARAIHRHSARGKGPFIDINCSAIPTSLFESELFGHERGAFTDAHLAKPGRFEQAQGGTLFLDEVGDLALDAQGKLLRALERCEITRLGATHARRVDVRIIAATNAALEESVARGTFRRDLFYRLSVLSIRLPPLRERGGDLGRLIDHLLHRLPRQLHVAPKTLSREAREALLSWRWPGNVRELENALRHGLVTAPGDVVEVSDLPPHDRTGSTAVAAGRLPAGLTLGQATARVAVEFEEACIREALAAERGNLSAAARTLGIDRRTLYGKLRRLGLG